MESVVSFEGDDVGDIVDVGDFVDDFGELAVSALSDNDAVEDASRDGDCGLTLADDDCSALCEIKVALGSVVPDDVPAVLVFETVTDCVAEPRVRLVCVADQLQARDMDLEADAFESVCEPFEIVIVDVVVDDRECRSELLAEVECWGLNE